MFMNEGNRHFGSPAHRIIFFLEIRYILSRILKNIYSFVYNKHEYAKPIDILLLIFFSFCMQKDQNALTSLHFTTYIKPTPLTNTSVPLTKTLLPRIFFLPEYVQLRPVADPVLHHPRATTAHEASTHRPVLRPPRPRKPHHPGLQAHMHHFLKPPPHPWHDNVHTMAQPTSPPP